jgi:hypothetical protein
VGADVSSVELAGREVGHFVAEDFLEKSVGGGFEVRGDADKALVGIAAAEAPRQARRDLDSGLGGEVRGLPGLEPVVKRSLGLVRNRKIVDHGDEG